MSTKHYPNDSVNIHPPGVQKRGSLILSLTGLPLAWSSEHIHHVGEGDRSTTQCLGIFLKAAFYARLWMSLDGDKIFLARSWIIHWIPFSIISKKGEKGILRNFCSIRLYSVHDTLDWQKRKRYGGTGRREPDSVSRRDNDWCSFLTAFPICYSIQNVEILISW